MSILLNALLTLLRHYFKIVPFLILGYLIYSIAGSMIPYGGAIILSPFYVGFAYITTYVTLSGKMPQFKDLFVGFNYNFSTNLLYMFLHHLITSIAYGISVIVLFFIFLYNQDFVETLATFGPGFLALFAISVLIVGGLFIPPFIVSLILSMVPYLLADPKFDAKENSPLTTSIRMLKGHYLRLFLLRILFLLWAVWVIVGSLITVLLIFASQFGDIEGIPFMIVWFSSLPITIFIITPWYRMVHTLLYVELRKDI